MKAKDVARQIINEPDDKKKQKILFNAINEKIVTLLKQRGGSHGAIVGIEREMRAWLVSISNNGVDEISQTKVENFDVVNWIHSITRSWEAQKNAKDPVHGS